MAQASAESDLEIDYLFSGRHPDRFFDMACFGNYQTRRGLTFAVSNGRIAYRRTIRENSIPDFLAEVLDLNLKPYDLVLTDFEPVTAWAGRLRGKHVISLGHQPAFDYAVPTAGRDLCSAMVMRLFAPGRTRIGMHWNSFGAPILPPIIHAGHESLLCDDRKVLVYLPFEDQARVQALLGQIDDYQFYIYAPENVFSQHGNLHCRPTSLAGFKADLHSCSAVICNAGFELSSECLALGKRLMVKPVERQMEQASNALALCQLGYGASMEQIAVQPLRRWLDSGQSALQIDYPDVAAALLKWLRAGDYAPSSLQKLSDQLWRRVAVHPRPASLRQLRDSDRQQVCA
jgi:uncharacterized protein (TIGR00661 family)